MQDIKRIDYIDLLKALAIYLVVFYHFNRVPVNILDGGNYGNLYFKSIFSVGVPIFFFMNGLLLLNKKQLDLKKHVRKIFNIVLLTFLWSLITLVALNQIKGETFSVFEIIKGVWFFKDNYNNHLWFLATLVGIYFFYPLLHHAYHFSRDIFFFFFAGVMLFTIGNTLLGNLATTIFYFQGESEYRDFHINYFADFNPFRGIYGFSIAYFMLGGIMGGREFLSVLEKRKGKYKAFAIFVIPFSMLGLSLFAVVASLQKGEIWDIVWNGYDTVFTLINVVAIYIISISYKSSGWLGRLVSIIGRNSLGIYFLHVIIGSLLEPYFSSLEYSHLFFVNLLYALFVLLCSLALTLVFKRVPVIKFLFSL